MFIFSHQQINIVLAKDGIHTLVNIIIANPMNVNLFLQSCATQGFIAFNAIQTKKKNYCDQTPHWSIPPDSD